MNIRRQVSGLGLGLFLLVALSGDRPAAQAPAETPDVQGILDRALARTAWIEAQNVRARYRFSLSSVSQKLTGDGEVSDEEVEIYEIAPVRGFSYARLVSKDDEPLDPGDERDERKRYAEFVKRIDEGKDPYGDDEPQVGFDDELVSKYDFTHAGTEVLDGRTYDVLAFEPRPGKLPTRRRMDYALNKSRGRIWFDADTSEVGRVQFELTDRVRLWWGIIGSISEARGLIERRPVDDGVWLPQSARIYLNGRILFKSLHREITNAWSDFQPVDPIETVDP